ncbi:hypothetical protein SORBI_3004G338701 [Sorghum bicolor]|uniref:Uncharacterized protein n=1 Tax=Sorghum bicolor TaxID=4558 RepID=A0A1Z5RQ77_SORBI|nr:hypothetical protein SORBI_3004G338701 [Sorghum bicolor]
MEFFDVLPMRFHFNGEFVRDSNDLFYVGGTQAMSYIDRDKLSLPEVLGKGNKLTKNHQIKCTCKSFNNSFWISYNEPASKCAEFQC